MKRLLCWISLLGSTYTFGAVPVAPSNLNAVGISSTEIQLTWQDNSSDETAFEIWQYRGGWTQLSDAGVNATTYTSGGLTPSTYYTYYVRAKNASGVSGWSNNKGATTLSGGATCIYSISPTSVSIAAAGGTGSFAITVGSSCVWTAASNAAWITFTTSTNGMGNGSIGYSVAENTDPSPRSSSIVVAGLTFSIAQAAGEAPCPPGTAMTISVTPAFGTVVDNIVTLTGTPDIDGVKFILDGVELSEDPDAPYQVSFDSNLLTNGIHEVTVTAVDATNGVLATSSGIILVSNTTSCSYSISPTSANYASSIGAGSVGVTTDSGCNWTAVSDSSWLAIVSGASGTGNGSVVYSLAANTTIAQRVGVLTIAGETCTITQAGVPVGGGLWRYGSTGSDISRCAALDPSGNMFIAGLFQATVNFGGTTLTSPTTSSIFVAKYNSAGTLQWAKMFNATTDQTVLGLSTDVAGDVIITGNYIGTINFGGGALVSAGVKDIFLTKLSGSNGAHMWSKRFGSTKDDIAYTVATDSGTNVLVAGYFTGLVSFGGTLFESSNPFDNDIFLAKFNSSGTHVWSKGGTNSFPNAGFESVRGVAVDTSNNIYMTGTFNGLVDFGSGSFLTASNGVNDIFLAKYNSSGTHQWSKRFGNTNNDYGYAVACAPNGDVVVSGTGISAIDFGGGLRTGSSIRDVFVARFTGAGSHVWSAMYGGTSNDEPSAITTDSSGNTTVTGYFQSTGINFGGGTLLNSGAYEIFLANFSPSGTHLWSYKYGGSGYDVGNGVVVDAAGNTIMTGYFNGTATFAGTDLLSAGSNDIFLMRKAP